MGVVNFASTIFAFIYFGLIVLLIVFFTLFIRRILINSSKKNQHLEEFEKSLKKLQNYLKRIKMPISISTIVPFRQMIDILALVVIPLVFVIEKSVKNSLSTDFSMSLLN